MRGCVSFHCSIDQLTILPARILSMHAAKICSDGWWEKWLGSAILKCSNNIPALNYYFQISVFPTSRQFKYKYHMDTVFWLHPVNKCSAQIILGNAKLMEFHRVEMIWLLIELRKSQVFGSVS